MTTDLEQRIRSYGAQLDRRASELQAGSAGGSESDVAPLIRLEDTSSRPPFRWLAGAVAAASLIVVGTIALAHQQAGRPSDDQGVATQPGVREPGVGEPGAADRSEAEPVEVPPHSDMDRCVRLGEDGRYLVDPRMVPVPERGVPDRPTADRRSADDSVSSHVEVPRAPGPDPDDPSEDVHVDWDRGSVSAHGRGVAAPDAVGVWAACLAALEGEVLASGVAAEVEWELVASEEPSGRWVQLRAGVLDGMFRLAVDRYDEEVGLFSQLGVCCRVRDAGLFVAVTNPDVATVEIDTPDGRHVVDTVAPEGSPVRFAVAAGPTTGQGQVLFRFADGSTIDPVPGGIDLASRGG